MSKTEDDSRVLECDLCPHNPDHAKLCPQWSEVDYALHLKLMHECEICKMLCQSYLARETHYERIHGKYYRPVEWFEVAGGEVITRFGRLVDLIGWRNPVDLLDDVPKDPERLCRWLYPMCAEMLQFKHPEAGLFSPPSILGSQALYIEANFPAFLELSKTARFKRLKGTEARARLMAMVLAIPTYSPGYAEQQLRGCWTEDSH